MFRTRQLSTATLSLVAAAIVVAASANAAEVNVQAYHHRSTILGDHLSGYADAVDAEGRYLRNRSVAYKTFISALRDREKLVHEHKEYVRYEEELKQQDIEARAERNRRRVELADQELKVSAQLLLEDIQTRRHIWDDVLAAEKFAVQRFQIETLLRNWEDGYPSDRRRLELLVRDIRADLQANPPENKLEWREAVATLKRLRTLSESREYSSEAQVRLNRVNRLPASLTNMMANN